MYVFFAIFLIQLASAERVSVFIDPKSLYQSSAFETKLVAAKFLEKIPHIELKLISPPTGAADTSRFSSDLKATFERADFDIGIVTVQSYFKILNLHRDFIPVAEMASGASKKVCLFGITYLQESEKKPIMDPKIGSLSGNRFQKSIEKLLSDVSSKPIVYDQQPQELLALLKKGSIDLIATTSLILDDSPETHPFYTQVESKTLSEIKTKETPIPCTVVIRKKSNARAQSMEKSLFYGFSEIKNFNRIFLETSPQRRSEIIELIKNN